MAKGPLGAVPARLAGPLSAASVSHAGANLACSPCQPPLLYHGDPSAGVMGPTANPGAVTVTPTYWAPPGFGFPSPYRSLLQRYLTDVTAASGGHTNVFSVMGEYYRPASATAPAAHVSYNITPGAELDLTGGYPAPGSSNGCSPAPGYSACVTNGALLAALQSGTASFGATVDTSHLYSLYLPPGVEVCWDSGGSVCSGSTFCGYHSVFSSNTGTLGVFAVVPYPQGACQFGVSPNGDMASDNAINVITHEIAESITDWSGQGWTDIDGAEIGDECVYIFSPPIGSTDPANAGTTAFDQVINGHPYWLQDLFSNAAWWDGIGDVGVTGCMASESAPQIGAGNLPTGYLGVRYFAQIQSSGSPTPRDSITAGQPPPGLTLDPTGILAGVPRAAGSYTFAVTAASGVDPAATATVTVYVAGPAPAGGYLLAAADGGVFNFGSVRFEGAVGRPGAQQVAAAVTGGGRGYWLLDTTGDVTTFGDAAYHGSGPAHGHSYVAMARTGDGGGYWLITGDGVVAPLGDAGYHGQLAGVRLNQPIVAFSPTSDGGGYRLVASDGGVFAFGDARFYGSTGGIRLNQPVVAAASTPDGQGYWLVASDGGVFAFGDARFYGSVGSTRLAAPIVAVAVP